VAKKKKLSQLQHQPLLQHQLPLLQMQHLLQLQLLQLPVLLLLLLLQLQHQPASNSLPKRKKPLSSGFFFIFIPAYLINCSSNKVNKR
jgi:hypothetical protein